MTRDDFWTLYWMLMFGIALLDTALPDPRLENFLCFMGIALFLRLRRINIRRQLR